MKSIQNMLLLTVLVLVFSSCYKRTTWGVKARESRSGQLFVRRNKAGPAIGCATRVQSVEQLVEFVDQHGEAGLVLLFGDEIAELLHALFRSVI